MRTYLQPVDAYTHFIVVERKLILTTLGKAGTVHACEIPTQYSNRSLSSGVIGVSYTKALWEIGD
jgi:hypothetical protein